MVSTDVTLSSQVGSGEHHSAARCDKAEHQESDVQDPWPSTYRFGERPKTESSG